MSATFNHSGLVEALEHARKARGMSWREVAVEAGLGQSTLYRIVSGAMPDLPRFAALVDWLGLPTEIFFTRSGGARVTIADASGPLVYISLPEGVTFTVEDLAEYQRTARTLLLLMLRSSPGGRPAKPA